MGQITLQRVRKSFGSVNIIRDANLDIEDGSFVVFVGLRVAARPRCCA
jgi:multiple sugar transport system ATP-binding protein